MSVTTGLKFLTSKWRTWFKTLDINADGAITPLDLEMNTRRFIEVFKIFPPEEGRRLAQLNKMRWEKFIFRGMTNPFISEADFINHLTNSYTKDKNELKKFVHQSSESLFGFADVNRDGMMSIGEMEHLFRAYGANNDLFVKNLHRNLGPDQQNLVSIKRASEEWVDFLTGDDENKYNAIVDAFKESPPRLI